MDFCSTDSTAHFRLMNKDCGNLQLSSRYDAAAVVIDAEGVDHEAAPEQEGAAADDGERHRRQRDLRVHCAGRRCIHISTSTLGPPLQLCHARLYFYTVTQLVEFKYMFGECTLPA